MSWIINVSAGVFVSVFKRTFLLGLAPKDLVIAVGVEGRVNVNEVNASIGQFGELFEIGAAIATRPTIRATATASFIV